MKSIAYIIYIVGTLLTFNSKAQVFDAVIAADGSGDYTSIQQAIDRLRGNAGRVRFFIKSGEYVEKVAMQLDNISLIGENKDEVIISWDDYSGDEDNHTTANSYTLLVSGDNVYLSNITIENTAGNVGQAVALSTTGTNQIIENCILRGFQDTYYAKSGIQYFRDTYIEGATDFVFGESTAVFENCEIQCLNGGQYITAPADTKLVTQVDGEDFYHGLLFLNSKITSEENVANNSYYLARPWQPNSSSVFVNCELGNHIKPEGWSTWDGNNHLTGIFAEYNSQTPNGESVDISQRVDWSSQLSAQQVEDFYNLDYFLDGWDAQLPIKKLEAPAGLTESINADDQLRVSWSDVADASGYAVYKNGSLHAFTETSDFIDTLAQNGDLFAVSAINELGTFGELSSDLEISTAVVLSNKSPENYRIVNGMLRLSQKRSVSVFSMDGKQIESINADSLNLKKYKSGVYLIKIKGKNTLKTIKIAL